MNNRRNINLDVMRIIGVFIIMVAHSHPPLWISQLRNFGTPLLIVTSGLTYAFIYQNRTILPSPFLKKRLIRLIYPAWIFLTFFFLFFWGISVIFEIEYPFTLNKIGEAYSFQAGIGFMWIFKVYIILALITPISLHLRRSISSKQLYFSLLLLAYILYEVIRYGVNPFLPQFSVEFMNKVVWIVIPYAIFYLYGMRLSELSNRDILVISLISFLIFLVLSITLHDLFGHFVLTQEYKYPPTLYYVSYALFATNILYFTIRNYLTLAEKTKRVIIWLSSNALWIYLWHILAFYGWRMVFGEADNSLMISSVKALFMLSFGVGITALQNRIKKLYASI